MAEEILTQEVIQETPADGVFQDSRPTVSLPEMEQGPVYLVTFPKDALTKKIFDEISDQFTRYGVLAIVVGVNPACNMTGLNVFKFESRADLLKQNR